MTQDIGDWALYLSLEKNKDYFSSLFTFLNSRIDYQIYPPRGTWFKAFEYSSFASTKVIILGQDPYHGEGQAEGLSFSVPKDITITPTLRNIYKELEEDNADFVNYVRHTYDGHAQIYADHPQRFEPKEGVDLTPYLRHFPQLHTNPVNVIVEEKPIRASADSARWCLDVIDQLWKFRSNRISEKERPAARAAYDRAEAKFSKIAEEAAVRRKALK